MHRTIRFPNPSNALTVRAGIVAMVIASGLKAIAMSPVYAGVGDAPRRVSDEDWVAENKRIIEDDGPDRFLVNLLYILRRTFGCQE